MSRIRMIVLGFLLGMMCIGCSNQNEVESERYEMEGRLLKSVSGSHYIVANNGGLYQWEMKQATKEYLMNS